MKINERWEALKEKSPANIHSEKGILKRQTLSIQTERHFGDIKENKWFRRFHYRGTEKVYKEFMLYAMGRNINKYHWFFHEEIQWKNRVENSLKKRANPTGWQNLKKPESMGFLLFLEIRG